METVQRHKARQTSGRVHFSERRSSEDGYILLKIYRETSHVQQVRVCASMFKGMSAFVCLMKNLTNLLVNNRALVDLRIIYHRHNKNNIPFLKSFPAVCTPIPFLSLLKFKSFSPLTCTFTQVEKIEILLYKYVICDDVVVKEMAQSMLVKFAKYWEDVGYGINGSLYI